MHLNDIAVIIGMPRTGTTWLYENLKHHPDICTSTYKEINRYLFDLTDEQYLNYFCDCSKPIKLDVSPFYYLDRQALLNISRHHDKVILLVREEAEWIESLKSQISKWESNVNEMEQTKRYVLKVGGKELIFDYAAYRHQQYLDEVKEIFGAKLLVLEYSLLQREPILLLKRIEGYLGIRPYFSADTCSLEKINTREQKMSKLYALMIRTNMLHKVIPVVLTLLPRSLVHWLRQRLVYGRGT